MFEPLPGDLGGWSRGGTGNGTTLRLDEEGRSGTALECGLSAVGRQFEKPENAGDSAMETKQPRGETTMTETKMSSGVMDTVGKWFFSLCPSTPGGGHVVRTAHIAEEAVTQGRWDYASVLLAVRDEVGAREVTIALTPYEIEHYLVPSLLTHAHEAKKIQGYEGS
jgi:hypothetical protein